MAQPTDVTGLLRAASRADNLADQQQFIAQAEVARTASLRAAQADRELDLANAVVRDHLMPARVHEHHTAATDWVGSLDTSGGDGFESEMIAQGSLWYSKLHEAVRADTAEFTEQAAGFGRRLSGAYGERADVAEQAFLTHVSTLRTRELRSGLITEATSEKDADDDDYGDGDYPWESNVKKSSDFEENGDTKSTNRLGSSGLPQVGEAGAPVADATVGPPTVSGLPGELTSSNRAPAMQSMQNNTGPVGDATTRDPSQLPQFNPDIANGDEGDRRDDRPAATTARKEASMQTANCPTCQGHGRVAVRTQAASGLDQIDQVIDPSNAPKETPYPEEVAFPWEMNPGQQANSIQEAEQQLAQREQLKGASRKQRAAYAAKRAAEHAYMHVMGGQDDSGWAGDMGAGGVQPGMQDTGNPGPIDSLPYTDPVYGQGGDQGNKDLKPYGADEADDVTNNPGMNYSPGQPLQMDQAGRANMIGQPTASLMRDPEIAKAYRFIQQRANLINRR